MGETEKMLNIIKIDTITRHHFDFLQVIGKGSSGKVYKALFKRNRKYIAIKEMSKKELFEKGMIPIAFNEKNILSQINHNFISNMYCSFQDKDNLYLVLNLMTGRDLRFYLNSNKQFTEEQIKFFIACIITAVEYLQTKGIVHRDIKPENLICDDRGYLRLIDFGIARMINQGTTSHDSSGTSGYIAPECLMSNKLSFDADYFSIGVILFELCFGARPFHSKTSHEMVEEFKAKEIKVEPEMLSKRFNKSLDLCDIINQLLEFKPNKRLGHNSINDIKEHKWFHKFNWIDLSFKTLISPFTPKISETIISKQSHHHHFNEDMIPKDKVEKLMDSSTIDETNNNNADSFQDHFKNFTHNNFLLKRKEDKGRFKIKNLLNKTQLSKNRLDKIFTEQKTYICLKPKPNLKDTQSKFKINQGFSSHRTLSQSLSTFKCYHQTPQKKYYDTQKQEDSSVKFPLISINQSDRTMKVKERRRELSITSKWLFNSKRKKFCSVKLA